LTATLFDNRLNVSIVRSDISSASKWPVYGNNSELQSNNQAAFILQSSCMQPFHLPSTGVVPTWLRLLSYAKFGSESWNLRWPISKLYVKHYVWISFGFFPIQDLMLMYKYSSLQDVSPKKLSSSIRPQYSVNKNNGDSH
jgi:hypothetical protein